jgi:hypothetical protein
MSEQFCEHESAVIRAARADMWDNSLHSHAQTCSVCAEAMRVHAAMSSLIKHEQIPPIPDPRLIWLKAQFAERQRRSTIITRIAAVAYAALIAVFGFGLYSLIERNLVEDGVSPYEVLGQVLSYQPIYPFAIMVLLVWYLFSASPKKFH